MWRTFKNTYYYLLFVLYSRTLYCAMHMSNLGQSGAGKRVRQRASCSRQRREKKVVVHGSCVWSLLLCCKLCGVPVRSLPLFPFTVVALFMPVSAARVAHVPTKRKGIWRGPDEAMAGCGEEATLLARWRSASCSVVALRAQKRSDLLVSQPGLTYHDR